jgi:hypothetical protein
LAAYCALLTLPSLIAEFLIVKELVKDRNSRVLKLVNLIPGFYAKRSTRGFFSYRNLKLRQTQTRTEPGHGNFSQDSEHLNTEHLKNEIFGPTI